MEEKENIVIRLIKSRIKVYKEHIILEEKEIEQGLIHTNEHKKLLEEVKLFLKECEKALKILRS